MKGTFAGANIKGTPSMKAKAVRHDMRKLKKRADVIGLQEFKWRWYWQVLIALVDTVWSSFPGLRQGLRAPSAGAQAILWKRRLFKRVKTYVQPAFDFRLDNSGIMENRFIRGVLLRARSDGFTSWFLSAHFVVGGDEDSDSERRKVFMRQNIAALDAALTYMRRTGYPIMGELDANIHRGTWAYVEFMKVMTHHGARMYGELGVEYAFTIDGRKGSFTKVRPSRITPDELATDHEVRLLTWTGHARKS